MYKLLALSLLLLASPAFAEFGTCTGHTTVATTSTQVIAENDVPGGRHLMEIANTGTNPMYCSIGESGGATTSNGVLIQPAGAWHLESIEGVNGVFILIPIGQVDCIATGGTTTAVFCDY